MAKENAVWRMRALEVTGYAMLAPWVAAHTSVALTGLGWDLGQAWVAENLGAPQASTLVLFMLPVIALTLGMAGIHSLLWSSRGRSVFSVLVVLSSLCLVGSVIGSAVSTAKSRANNAAYERAPAFHAAPRRVLG
jgi:hypothetical protein